MMRFLLATLLAAGAAADKQDGLPAALELGGAGRPPSCPHPPCPSCAKAKTCSDHGKCTKTVGGGTCVCNPGYTSPETLCATETPALAALVLKYETLKNATCAKVLPHLPELDATDSAAFMDAYQKFSCDPKTKKCNGTEDAVQAAAQKVVAEDALDTFLSLPDSFAAADGLDATMVKCAVMTQAARWV